MDHMIHIAAISQIRLDTPGRVYYRRKLAEGKTPLEALRCLKRRISDAIYRQLLADAAQAAESADPGGHCGASLDSSAVDLHPPHRHFGSATPGPATPTLRPTTKTRKRQLRPPA